MSGPRARVLVVNDRDEVALLRRRVLGLTYWEVPGGHVEAGESSEQAAVREIGEELSLDLGGSTPLSPVGRVRVHQLYVARVRGAPEVRMNGPEVALRRRWNRYDPLWVPRSRAAHLLFVRPGVRRAVARALRAPG